MANVMLPSCQFGAAFVPPEVVAIIFSYLPLRAVYRVRTLSKEICAVAADSFKRNLFRLAAGNLPDLEALETQIRVLRFPRSVEPNPLKFMGRFLKSANVPFDSAILKALSLGSGDAEALGMLMAGWLEPDDSRNLYYGLHAVIGKDGRDNWIRSDRGKPRPVLQLLAQIACTVELQMIRRLLIGGDLRSEYPSYEDSYEEEFVKAVLLELEGVLPNGETAVTMRPFVLYFAFRYY
jgi:hypothetical protein